MARDALKGLAIQGTVDEFSPDRWFQPFFDDYATLMRYVMRALPTADLVPLGSARALAAARPLPREEPVGHNLAWPSPRAGLGLLVVPEGDTPNITDAWPFVSGGRQSLCQVEAVRLAPNRLLAFIHARSEGFGLCYHEVHFANRRPLYYQGARHMVDLIGLALSAEKLPESALNHDDRFLLDRPDIAPHAYEFVGEIVAVRPYESPVLDQTLTLASVAVSELGKWARVIDVALTGKVLGASAAPSRGDILAGIMLLQGTVSETVPQLN